MFRLTRVGCKGMVSNVTGVEPTPPVTITPPTVWWNFEGPDEDAHWPSEGDPSVFLREANTIIAEAGLVGNCATFPATNDFLYIDPETYVLGPDGINDFSVAFWYRANSLPDVFFNGTLYTLSSETSNSFLVFYVATNGDTALNIGQPEAGVHQFAFPGAAVVGEWHFYCARYTAIDHTVYASLDGGTEDSFVLADFISLAHPYQWFFGWGGATRSESFDSCGWWQTHALTPQEIAWLYNGGAGRAYP